MIKWVCAVWGKLILLSQTVLKICFQGRREQEKSGDFRGASRHGVVWG